MKQVKFTNSRRRQNKCNSHTEPIFKNKTLQFLKLNGIFKLEQLKFYYKLITGDLPKYLHHSYTQLCNSSSLVIHYTSETSSILIPESIMLMHKKHISCTTQYRQSIVHQTLSLIKSIHKTCTVSSITLKSLYLIIMKITHMLYICYVTAIYRLFIDFM